MTGSAGGRYRDALRTRDFRLMVVAYVVDALGGWAYSVVLAVYVWDRTHSTQWLAAMASAGWLTRALLLFHHAPDRTDDELDAIVAAFADEQIPVMAAIEGSVLQLG